MHKHITERLTYRRVLQLIGLLIAGAIGLMWLRGDDIPIEGLEDQHESLLYLLGVGAGLVLWALTIFRPQWVKGILRRYSFRRICRNQRLIWCWNRRNCWLPSGRNKPLNQSHNIMALGVVEVP